MVIDASFTRPQHLNLTTPGYIQPPTYYVHAYKKSIYMRLSGMLDLRGVTGAAPGVEPKLVLKLWISTISIVSPGRGNATSSFLEIMCTARVLLSEPVLCRCFSYISSICALVVVSSATASISSTMELLHYSPKTILKRLTLKEIAIARPDFVPVIVSFFLEVFSLLPFFDYQT